MYFFVYIHVSVFTVLIKEKTLLIKIDLEITNIQLLVVTILKIPEHCSTEAPIKNWNWNDVADDDTNLAANIADAVVDYTIVV